MTEEPILIYEEIFMSWVCVSAATCHRAAQSALNTILLAAGTPKFNTPSPLAVHCAAENRDDSHQAYSAVRRRPAYADGDMYIQHNDKIGCEEPRRVCSIKAFT